MQDKLLKILIPAVGGQGGGILTEWLIKAFEAENYDVQGISLPGLSQRGGSTTYYIEAFPNDNNTEIIFSQYPLPGDIDLILSQELLELGRVLKEGYGSDKTTIISSTHRTYSTQEKLPISSGIYSEEVLTNFAKEFSGEFIGIETLELARQNGMDELAANAILIGALSSAGLLPLRKESFQNAIESVGIAVKINLKAFDVGYDHALNNKTGSGAGVDKSDFENNELKYISANDREKIETAISSLTGFYPDFLVPLISEAVVRLADYQGFWYSDKYLSYIDRIRTIDDSNPNQDFKLCENVIKNLALLMSYEDGIRVSELKIRDERFKRIKEEMMIKDNQVFSVVDYLKPDAEEVYGLFPNFMIAPAVYLINTGAFKIIWRKKEPLTISQKPVTTSFFGFFRVWLLSKLRFMRPYSYRYRNEHRIIDIYLDSVDKYARVDYDLGTLVSRSGSVIKGYGRVRRRTIEAFLRLNKNVLEKLYVSEKEGATGFELTKQFYSRALDLISENEDGIEEAERLVEEELK